MSSQIYNLNYAMSQVQNKEYDAIAFVTDNGFIMGYLDPNELGVGREDTSIKLLSAIIINDPLKMGINANEFYISIDKIIGFYPVIYEEELKYIFGQFPPKARQ